MIRPIGWEEFDDRQTDTQTDDRQSDKSNPSVPYDMERIAHVQLRQAMIYNAGRVRSLSTKFQVDTCKTIKDRSAHAQLRTL